MGVRCLTWALLGSYSGGCPQGNIEASIKNNIVLWYHSELCIMGVVLKCLVRKGLK